MGAASAFSAAAVLVACAFAGATFERWLARRRRHDLAWATSMALFAAGALAYFFGVALGWRPWSFKAFYLLGGVLTVPVLALGTIYLLIGRRWGDRLALATALVGAFASGVIVSAPCAGRCRPIGSTPVGRCWAWGPGSWPPSAGAGRHRGDRGAL